MPLEEVEVSELDNEPVLETEETHVVCQGDTTKVAGDVHVTEVSNTLNNQHANDVLEPPMKKLKMSRKRQRSKHTWKKVVAAKAREKGESYMSQKGTLVPAKCVSEGNLCREKCRLKCSEKLNIEQRKSILKDFYKLDVNGKNALLFKTISKTKPRRKRKGAKKHKAASYKYNVTFKGEQMQVCKQAVSSLFKVGFKKLEIIQNKIKTGSSAPEPDRRGQHKNRPHKISEDVKTYVKKHIASFPAEYSHYSRASNPNRKYLSPMLSVSKMHELYIEQCTTDRVENKYYVKQSMYRRLFVTEFNLSFAHPKSDTCSTCDAGECTEEHIEFYKAAFDAQKSDRKSAKSTGNNAYMTMDLQQTMPLPRLTTSKAFYKRQMWFYNLGLHITCNDMDKGLFCTWTEDIASRGSTEVASSLLTAIELDPKLRERDHLVIWTDSCAGQNKNFQMICVYQYMVLKGYFKSVEHKFPEVGHSFLDSDRDFGRIEKVLRQHANIYLPEQYRHIIAKASKANQVLDMEHHFRDIDEVASSLRLINRKKDVLGQTVRFRDGIKWIRVEEYGSYLFKESYDPYTPFRKVNILRYKSDKEDSVFNIAVPRIGKKIGVLSTEKKSDVKDLLKFVPLEYQWYYDAILRE